MSLILLLLVSIISLVQGTLWRYGGMQCNGDDFLSACYNDQCGRLHNIPCWQLYNSGYCPDYSTGCYNNPYFDPTDPNDATSSWNVYDTTNAPTCFQTCNTNYLACKATYGCGNCLYDGLITAASHAGDCGYTATTASGTWIPRPVGCSSNPFLTPIEFNNLISLFTFDFFTGSTFSFLSTYGTTTE